MDGNYFNYNQFNELFPDIFNSTKAGKSTISNLVRFVLPIYNCLRDGQFFIAKFYSLLFSSIENNIREVIFSHLKDVRSLPINRRVLIWERS